MDRSAPYTVVQGTFITSALSAFVTGLYGITTSHPTYGILAGAAALNSGITAATFFGLREYVVSPLFVSTLPFPQYARRRRELGVVGTARILDPEPPRSQSEKRRHKLIDSGLSGAFTGGILRGWKSGPGAILPGALTAATVCVALQYAYNEAGIARLRYISRQNAEDAPSSLNAERPPQTLISKPPASFMDRVMHLVGVRKMADEECLERMKKTRDLHLQRIAELEKQLEPEHRNDGDA